MSIINKLLEIIWCFLFSWIVLPVLILTAIILVPIGLIIYLILLWIYLPFSHIREIWSYE